MKKHLVLLSSITAIVLLQTGAYAGKLSELDEHALASIDTVGKQPEQQNDVLTGIMIQAASNIAAKPDDYRSHFILGKAYEKLGMEELASDEYKKAEESGEQFKEFVLNSLKSKVLASEFAEAMSYYPLAAKFYPKDAAVAITHAIQLHKQGKIEEEEKLLSELSAQGKQDLGVMSALAAIKLEKKQYENALELFDKDLAQNPQYQPAILGKALVLSLLGRHGSSLELALPLYRQGAWSNYELASLVANNFSQLGIYVQAYQPALVSLAVSRRQSELDSAKRRIIFVWKHLSPKQRADGLAEVSEVLNKTMFGPRLHFALGDVLQQADYTQEALAEFRNGLQLEPRHARAYLHIAEIYEKYFHNKSTAMLNYLKYMHYSGGDPLVELRLKRMSLESTRSHDIALRIKRKMYSTQ